MDRIFRVILSPEAFDNLDDIIDYLKELSPQGAAHTVDRLWAATQSLNRFPYRYPVYQHRRNKKLIVRSMPVLPFIVYYRVVDETSTVRVLTIRHGARRQPKRFRR